MPQLTTLTTSINLLALAIALWLGFYIATRSPHSSLSWLATLTLWSLGGYFLHGAIAINLPGSGILTWLLLTVIIVLPLWFNLTVLLLSPVAPPRAHPRSAVINRVGVPLAYGLALMLIAVGLFTRELLDQVESHPAYLTSSRLPGPLYPLFILFLVLVFGLSLLNLWRGRQQTNDAVLRNRLDTLMVATVLAGLGGLWNSTGTWLHLDLPTVFGDAGLGAGVILLGYAVARYAALLEGRPLDRDFIYAILVVGALTAFYVLVTFVLYLGGQVTFLTLVLAIVGTIAANSLFDGIRLALDRIFYQRQFQQLRGNLRALAREAGTGGTLAERLQAILDALCRTMRIQKGFIALRQGEQYVVQATRDASPLHHAFEISTLASNETVGLVRSAKMGIEGMTLLVPLFAGGRQIGAVVLGPKETNQPYADADLDLLEDLGDQIASVVHTAGLQEENAQTLNALLQDFREKERLLQLQMQELLAAQEAKPPRAPEAVGEESLLPQVEDAMRRLHDFPYLGKLPLAKLRVVERRLQARQDQSGTSLERGKALSQVLTQVLDGLRPDRDEPAKNEIPPREWHPFIILHDSYVLDEPNRNIMSRLYIGEGTFNRTRRRALKSLAKSLSELEQQGANGGT